jgi:ABC-type molybdate transport system permease subunit
MLHVYQGVCVLVAVLIGAVMLRSRSLGEQVTGTLVLVPLLLRIFLAK